MLQTKNWKRKGNSVPPLLSPKRLWRGGGPPRKWTCNKCYLNRGGERVVLSEQETYYKFRSIENERTAVIIGNPFILCSVLASKQFLCRCSNPSVIGDKENFNRLFPFHRCHLPFTAPSVLRRGGFYWTSLRRRKYEHPDKPEFEASIPRSIKT